MAKCALITKLLQLRVTTFLSLILWIIVIVNFFSYYGKYNYDHILKEEVAISLYKATVPQVNKKYKDCSFSDIIDSHNSLQVWEIPKSFEDFSPKGIVNGTFEPEHCNPVFSVAVIVTYRNRQKQLDIFLPYIHNFLRKQNIHYKLFLVEQQDEKPWNKGLLYNIGAKVAIAEKFPCLILHDVDLLPLDESNLYACAHFPRHVSASVDKFRFVLPYEALVGGVLAIRSDHYTALNGFSNKFENWGGEDDDFQIRISKHNLHIVRFPRHMSRYTMIHHEQAPKNVERLQIIADNTMKENNEGYNSIQYRKMTVKNNRLFALVGVKL